MLREAQAGAARPREQGGQRRRRRVSLDAAVAGAAVCGLRQARTPMTPACVKFCSGLVKVAVRALLAARVTQLHYH